MQPPPPSPLGFTVTTTTPAICTDRHTAIFPALFSSRTSPQTWVRLLRFSQVDALRSACNGVLRASTLPPLPPLHSSLFSSRTNAEYLNVRRESIGVVLQAAVDACVTKGHPLYCMPDILIGLGIDDLWRASAHGDLQHMQLLISLSWDIDRRTPFGCTPLHCACAFTQPAAISLLLQHQVPPPLQNPQPLSSHPHSRHHPPPLTPSAAFHTLYQSSHACP
jgi:hypothetical protein